MTELESLLRRIVGKEQGGYLYKADVADLARLDRLRMLLVRCGAGRFLAAAKIAIEDEKNPDGAHNAEPWRV